MQTREKSCISLKCEKASRQTEDDGENLVPYAQVSNVNFVFFERRRLVGLGLKK